MTTFLLVPGAGTDPRTYGATIAALAELGHDAVAPPLPLDDPGATPSDHAKAIAAAAPPGSEPVVVGQSLGAFAASIAAARLPARQLVLLAPMVPRPGETAAQWWESTGHAEAIAALIERHGPIGEWGEEAFVEVFLHDVDPDVAEANRRYSGAPGPGMFAEPWPLDAWPDVPTRVLAPREDRFFPLPFQRRVVRQRLDLEVDEMAGGHVPMLSRPGELAARLVELSEDAPSR